MNEPEAGSAGSAQFQVYLYDLPKVDAEGNSIPTDPAQTREFAALEQAREFMAERKRDFDRIVLVEKRGAEQKLIERYRDGECVRPAG